MENYSRKDIIEVISDLVKGDITKLEDKYILEITKYRKTGGILKVEVTFDELDAIISEINLLKVHDETSLMNDRYYEVVVREESISPIRRLMGDIKVNDSENSLTYDYSQSSVHYYVWLMLTMRRRLSLNEFKIGFASHSIFRSLDRLTDSDPLEVIPLEKLLKTLSTIIKTLKISSSKDISKTQFLRHSNAFLFQIGYNLDIALVPQRFLEEISRRGRIKRMRRSEIGDLDPPRRNYNESLVHRYLLAVSAENPVIEYLSYYHILEHFYEDVFNEDLLDTVKKSITDPSFSYKRKKDIEKVITIVKKSIKVGGERITFSELEALKLCIKKYVSLSDLKNKISEYDQEFLIYYKSNKVSFSNGSEINFDDNEIFIKKLSNRIYSTRNALVHSKDNGKSKYTPFKDDKSLVKEIPLMRFISEMVIINNSQVD